MDLILYIHGKGGSAAESEHYKPLFPDCEVMGLDYKTFTPWETGKEIRTAVEELKSKYAHIVLIANSIGAFFSMNAGLNGLIEKAYFISPIVDMEKLICDMMLWANVSEEELKAKGVISTAFGEDLSWEYLCYARSHPLDWRVPTQILYGSTDNLTSLETMRGFAQKHHAPLTVMEGGEHYFHTDEQMRFLDDWISGGVVAETERLTLRVASRGEMERFIAAQSDEALIAAYREMLDGALEHADEWAWYAIWFVERKDGAHIGDLCFKGFGADGSVEIGYGIAEEYQRHGYATEAVAAAVDWALRRSGVKRVEAEAEADNAASLRVLEKCGFVSTGTVGEEGPRFVRTH